MWRMLIPDFTPFQTAFPKDVVSSPSLALDEGFLSSIEEEFGIDLPDALTQFWIKNGTGYFGDRDLLFFSTRESPRDIVAWNNLPTWKEIFPEPRHGGPFFFAENCFGDQIGFRHAQGRLLYVLFVLDTCELFLVAEDAGTFFEKILGDKTALIDRELLERVRQHVGPLKPDHHYAPFVTPLLGGSNHESNFHQETARVHVITTIATFKATGGRIP